MCRYPVAANTSECRTHAQPGARTSARLRAVSHLLGRLLLDTVLSPKSLCAALLRAGPSSFFPCNEVCCSQFGACALDATTATRLQCCASGVVCGGLDTCAGAQTVLAVTDCQTAHRSWDMMAQIWALQSPARAVPSSGMSTGTVLCPWTMDQNAPYHVPHLICMRDAWHPAIGQLTARSCRRSVQVLRPAGLLRARLRRFPVSVLPARNHILLWGALSQEALTTVAK